MINFIGVGCIKIRYGGSNFFFFFFFAALNKFHLNRFGIKKFSEFYTCDEHVVYVWKLNRKSVSFLPLFNYTFQLYLAKKIFYTRKIFNICTIDNKFTFILIIIHKLLPIENIANFVIIIFQKKLRNSFLHHHPREINNSP